MEDRFFPVRPPWGSTPQPLNAADRTTEGGGVLFWEEAKKVLARLPRRGVPMILREIKPPKSRSYDPTCRYGGMTELEEAGLTDGQGRALSAHSSKAYDGYTKRTFKRALALRASVMPMYCRTREERNFRMRQQTIFRMEIGRRPSH